MTIKYDAWIIWAIIAMSMAQFCIIASYLQDWVLFFVMFVSFLKGIAIFFMMATAKVPKE